MNYNSSSIEKDLQENLKLYTAPPTDLGQDLFNVHREVSIIRYALSQQFKSYHLAVSILTDKLTQAVQLGNDPKILTDIMTCIYHIETKTASLIKSAREVIHLLGEAVNLDVDKAALRTMLVNLPNLVEESILSVTQDSQLSSRISVQLTQRISSLMATVRFDDNSLVLSQQNPGITLEQYSNFLDSVPSQP